LFSARFPARFFVKVSLEQKHIMLYDYCNNPQPETLAEAENNPVAMHHQQACLIFSIDGHLFALPALNVVHIIRAVAITPLPDGPDLVTGFLNRAGQFIPVMNLRRQFHLPHKTLQVSDRLILAEAYGFNVAFIADAVEDVAPLYPKPLSESEDLLTDDMKNGDLFPGMEKFIKGVAGLNSRTVLIYDIHSLFPEEAVSLATDAITHRQTKEPA
jgi:purine-binding chemotaxis protein CheW